MKGRILIIAGSDSSGGAGIQADIKTVTALGGYAMTAITALTAQNTEGVSGILDVPAAFVTQQIRLALADIGADCIKIGMLHRPEIIDAVEAVVTAEASLIPLVLDPVMIAKGGHPLLEPVAVERMVSRLVPMARLITPNIPEAEFLAGGPDDQIALCRRIMEKGARAVLLKGGHGEGNTVNDVLVEDKREPEIFVSPRLDTPHTHGTGCTLASAIATGLAQGFDLRGAVIRARAYVHEAIRTAPGFGRGHGPLNHTHTIGAWPANC
ncbi:MAG: bifunctional hydroxymethylpyrimidine kinase/phosphomethylpyrimidine kinase [Hyphomicrobiales bacterium]|nr:bifunctional hydroxymethylpyrimidine kinase/phosphomethylpyrimidine kinase [Hyphomicrobiales bacterium]